MAEQSLAPTVTYFRELVTEVSFEDPETGQALIFASDVVVEATTPEVCSLDEDTKFAFMTMVAEKEAGSKKVYADHLRELQNVHVATAGIFGSLFGGLGVLMPSLFETSLPQPAYVAQPGLLD